MPVKPGESLPPNAAVPLRYLNLMHLLKSNEHNKYSGNRTVWGNDIIQKRDFFYEPYGNGWLLNRSYFEYQLKTEALEKGANWLNWNFKSIEYQDSFLLLTCQDESSNIRKIRTNFAVDATGRASVLARQHRIERLRFDSLVAYCITIDQSCESLLQQVFIEAVENGWWYAAPLTNNRIVLNYMTDGDLHHDAKHKDRAWLIEELRRTLFLKDYVFLLHENEYHKISVSASYTSCLKYTAGNQWIAVGDAAHTYDPLCAFGLTSALGSSLYAARAIKDFLGGNHLPINAYDYIQQQSFKKCLTMLEHQYSLEKRFKGSLFWQRRSGVDY